MTLGDGQCNAPNASRPAWRDPLRAKLRRWPCPALPDAPALLGAPRLPPSVARLGTVESDSQGKVKMGPGTLYGSLGRMIDAGLIRESDKKVDPRMDDERRVYYRITGLGQKTLAAELERYREVVAVAKQRRLAPN